MQVYYTIIYTFVTYVVLVWGTTHKTNIQALVVLQNKAVRISSDWGFSGTYINSF